MTMPRQPKGSSWESLTPWEKAAEWHQAAPHIADEVMALAKEHARHQWELEKSQSRHQWAMDIRIWITQNSGIGAWSGICRLVSVVVWLLLGCVERGSHRGVGARTTMCRW